MKLKNYISTQFNLLTEVIINLKNKIIYYPLLILILILKNITVNKLSNESVTIFFSYKFRSKKLPNQEKKFNKILKKKNKKVFNFFYESNFITNFKILFQIIRYNKVNIILSSWSTNLPPFNFFLKNLKKFSLTKIFTIVYDSCHRDTERSFFDFTDHFIIADNPRRNFVPNKLIAKSINLNPIALNVPIRFYDLNLRYYIFNFIGQVNSYRKDREIYVKNLRDNFKNFYISTKVASNQNISNHDYYNIISKSLMTINFSNSIHSHQLKARTWEGILSGSLMLESRNDQSSMYFIENKEIIYFDSINDLIDKIKYFNRNKNEAKEIALNAQDKAINILNIQKKNFYEIYQ